MKLTSSHWRAMLFLTVCIPIRMYLAYLSVEVPVKWLPMYGLVFIMMSITFSILYFTNSRLKAMEGGGNTWWAPWRIVHASLLLAGGIMLIRKDNRAIIPLMADPVLGVALFVMNRLQ